MYSDLCIQLIRAFGLLICVVGVVLGSGGGVLLLGSVPHRVETVALGLTVAVVHSLQPVEFVVGVVLSSVRAVGRSDIVGQPHAQKVIRVQILHLRRSDPLTARILVVPGVLSLEQSAMLVCGVRELTDVVDRLAVADEVQLRVEGLVELRIDHRSLGVADVVHSSPIVVGDALKRGHGAVGVFFALKGVVGSCAGRAAQAAALKLAPVSVSPGSAAGERHGLAIAGERVGVRDRAGDGIGDGTRSLLFSDI